MTGVSRHCILHTVIERRGARRVEGYLNVEYLPVSGPAAPAVPTRRSLCQNVSESGLRFLVDDELAPQQELELLLYREERAHPISGRAVVMWCRATRRGPKRYEVGVQFTRIDPRQLAALIEDLREGWTSHEIL